MLKWFGLSRKATENTCVEFFKMLTRDTGFSVQETFECFLVSRVALPLLGALFRRRGGEVGEKGGTL